MTANLTTQSTSNAPGTINRSMPEESILNADSSKRSDNVKNRLTGWGLFGAALIAVAAGASDVGLTWDESMAHFWGSEVFRAWLALASELIWVGQWSALWDPALHQVYWPTVTPENQNYFTFNYHPPLTRILPTITWFLFNGMLGDVVAYRLAPALLFAASVLVVFRVMAREFDYATGLFSSLSLFLMPRVFGHAHIAATDTAMMAFWLFAVVAFYRGLEDKRWSLGFAALLGLAFSVKFTGVLIPLALILYMIMAREKRAWRNIGYSAAIAPVLLLALNPSWWVDPVAGIFNHYLLTPLGRNQFVPTPAWYLGELYPIHAPWHYSLVMTAVTLPIGISLFVVLGGIRSFGLRKNRWVLMIVSQLIFYYTILMLPLSPEYDGVRLFLPVFPFLACLAGLGFQGIKNRLWLGNYTWAVKFQSWGSHRIFAILFVAVFLWPAIRMAQIHPYYLEYYSGWTGGVAGAHHAGFETTYWFDTITPSVRKKINALPQKSRIGLWPPVVDYLKYMKDHGYLRKDLVIADTKLDYLILIPRQSQLKNFGWEMYRNKEPVFKQSLDGVPVVLMYRLQD